MLILFPQEKCNDEKRNMSDQEHAAWYNDISRANILQIYFHEQFFLFIVFFWPAETVLTRFVNLFFNSIFKLCLVKKNRW